MRLSPFSLLGCASLLLAHAAADPLPTSIDAYHLVWDSPSNDHNGSMPLGNGDIGLNAWVEPSGDLIFYISKTDAWDDNSRLCKVGRVRISLDPEPPVSPFKQELSLADGSLKVRYGDGTSLRLWVDANHPVIQVETTSPQPVTATAAVELWRTAQRTIATHETSDVLNKKPGNPPMVIEPDTVMTGLSDRVGWFHHNLKSVGPEDHAKVQGMTGFQREDPLLHRTFGAIITSSNPKRLDDTRLQSAAATEHRFEICVLTKHPASPDAWRNAADALVADIASKPLADRRAAHDQWWRAFWDRSWIRASSPTPSSPVPVNSLPLKIGTDQQGGSKFGGEIRNPQTPASFSGDFTVSAEVYPNPGATGRIFDKITVGASDGILLDLLAADTLRLIVGDTIKTAKNPLPANQWSKVSLTATGPKIAATVDGREVISFSSGESADDGAYLSQMFALQRFVTACAGRGAYPIKFNGTIFTSPYNGDPDYRKWGPGYWWQNTRLPYISACANGDFDLLEPLFAMYADRLLPLNQYRTQKYFGFERAAYYIECITFWGDVVNETYGWTPVEQRKDPLQESGWHKWEWVAGPELVWMMLEAYEHTGNEALLQQRILPTADAVIRFFDHYYKTNADGQLVMHPSMACETWWDCTNPMPELAGLHAITAKLLALPAGKISAEHRADWTAFAAKLAPLPVRDTPTGKALAPATRFAQKSNIENPELYAVFPFRLCSLEKPNRDLGIQALKHRWDSGHSGWRQDHIFMAYLGLTDQARAGIVARSRNYDRGSRFPAFWGPNYDWIPDQDHGGVLMKTAQAMLMQTDGDKILLLPAWPKDWNVSFKLHAPKNTTVEGEFSDGKLTRLTVSPESRRKDVRLPGEE